jgi:mono/diheme cytochrome c family protein
MSGMRTARLLVAGFGLAVVVLAVVGLLYVKSTGLSARGEPGRLEISMAMAGRWLSIPAQARARRNPIPASPDAVADGMAHYADHCAVCHANDGSGNTEMGRGFFPKAPDMRLATTQQLSDGELFYVIENGIRFTGMPAWSTGTAAGEESTWRLVHFLRHLPRVTAAELDAMKARNPRSPEEIRQEIEEERFLNGAQ